jgi:alpha-L-rhamnosidase
MQKIETSLRLSRRQVLALAGIVLIHPFSAAFGAVPPPANAAGRKRSAEYLRCEYRVNPLGMDAVRPRLSWTMNGTGRGARQTAYQVRVASSAEALARGSGNLWDSGRILTNQSTHVVYAGRPLMSGTRCHWQVRLWDEHGKSTGWSKAAFWTVGLLHPSDWKGQWISDAALAAPENRPRTPIHCYRSEIAHSPTDAKWIVLDLGAPKTFDGACLQPAKPDFINGDIATILYPVRFTIEASNAPDFHNAIPFVVRTDRDVHPPRPGFSNPERYRFSAMTARYIRLAVSRLAFWDGADYALALGKFQVFVGDMEIAAGATVTASRSAAAPGRGGLGLARYPTAA